MARYTGPATRKSRRLGVDLVGGDQSFEKRPYPPGQHGRARVKDSEYRQQLQEKQKARFSYGVMEKQFRRYYGEDSSGGMIRDGNSIFIFEVAGLCIGHLGHLHHKLDDTHFAAIGRLDIVMVPIDGTYTMSLDGVSEITKRLRSAVVLPMHRFATPLDEFMRLIGQQFVIDQRSERTLKISRDTLPGTPTVIILDGV